MLVMKWIAVCCGLFFIVILKADRGTRSGLAIVTLGT